MSYRNPEGFGGEPQPGITFNFMSPNERIDQVFGGQILPTTGNVPIYNPNDYVSPVTYQQYLPQPVSVGYSSAPVSYSGSPTWNPQPINVPRNSPPIWNPSFPFQEVKSGTPVFSAPQQQLGPVYSAPVVQPPRREIVTTPDFQINGMRSREMIPGTSEQILLQSIFNRSPWNKYIADKPPIYQKINYIDNYGPGTDFSTNRYILGNFSGKESTGFEVNIYTKKYNDGTSILGLPSANDTLINELGHAYCHNVLNIYGYTHLPSQLLSFSELVSDSAQLDFGDDWLGLIYQRVNHLGSREHYDRSQIIFTQALNQRLGSLGLNGGFENYEAYNKKLSIQDMAREKRLFTELVLNRVFGEELNIAQSIQTQALNSRMA